jgi:hypothetical protein
MPAEGRMELVNAWRESYNPLRSISIPRVVSMLEAAQVGQFAELHWTYSFIERRDADLMAIIERRTAALQEMDFNIKTVAKRARALGREIDSALADEQRACLVECYNKFANIYDAIEHMESAAFRGYSLSQFQSGKAAILPAQIPDVPGEVRLENLNSWNIAREGLYGDWYWNPSARDLRGTNLPADDRLDARYFLVRTHPRPINEIAIIKFLRQSLSEKDWDAFIEIYGIPGWIVILPPNVPLDKVNEYRDAAANVAEGGSGALPNGSDAKCADSPRGVVPFADRLRHLSEKLVLAGTGGLLTMLSAPGSGTLAGSAHMEAFRMVARSEARKIGELFQRQIDCPILDAVFPGKPHLAYFEIAANEDIDVDAILDHAVKASQAGYTIDAAQLSEKTGYTIVAKPQVSAPPPGFALAGGAGLVNRRPAGSPSLDSPDSAAVTSAVNATISQQQKLFLDWLDSVEKSLPETGSPSEFAAAIEAALKRMPSELMTQSNLMLLSDVGNRLISQAVIDGVTMAIEAHGPTTEGQP